MSKRPRGKFDRFKIVQDSTDSLQIQTEKGEVMCEFNSMYDGFVDSGTRLKAEYILKALEIANTTHALITELEKNEMI